MLRFDDSKNIETVSLSDIAERITRKNKGNETDLPLTISSIDGLVDQRDYFNKKVASRDMSNYFLLKKGEFAYNKSYSKGFDYGSIKMLDKYDEGALSPLYICFALKDGTNKDYMCHYFDSQKWYEEVAMICTEGARNHGILNVSPTDFMNMALTLHSDAEEQQKIADCLSSVDAVITDYEAQVENMQNQKKGVMQKLFSQEVRFKSDDGSEYPEWNSFTLGDIFEYERPDKYIVKTTDYTEEQLTPVLTANKGFLLGYTEETEGIHDETPTILFDDFTCDSKYVDFKFKVKSSAMKLLYMKDKSMPLKYGYELLNFIDFKPQGHARHWISIMQPIEVQIPCLEEQQKIADCLTAFDEAIEDLQKTVEHWKNIKKGLLQQLFA